MANKTIKLIEDKDYMIQEMTDDVLNTLDKMREHIPDRDVVDTLLEQHRDEITDEWKFFESKVMRGGQEYIFSGKIRKSNDYEFVDLCAELPVKDES